MVPLVDTPAAIGARLGIPPCTACREPLGARYRGLCWSCFERRYPAPKQRRRKREPTRYELFVGRVWRRLEACTESTVFYLDASHLAAYCPACREGTVLVTFAEIQGKPAARYSSQGEDGCSLGCTTATIMRALG